MERKRSIKNRERNQIDTGNTNKPVNNNANASSTIITSNMTRKTFSDLTNFNLIPTETLRNLCSNSLPSSEAQSLLRKSRPAPSFPTPKFPANSGPSKPYLVSDSDSRSATSIGSSNFTAAPYPQSRNPTSPQKNPTLTGENTNEMVTYSRRRAPENLTGQRKIAISPNTSINLEKKKNWEEAISVPLGPGNSERAKDKWKTVAGPFDSIPTVNSRDKGKGIADPIDSTPVGNLRVKEKEISLSFRSSDVKNRWDKGKAIYVPSTSTLVEKTKDCQRKANPHEEIQDKQKSIPELMNRQPLKKQKDTRKSDAMVLSCPPLPRTRKLGYLPFSH